MKAIALRTVLLGGLFSVAIAQAPAWAASPITVAFLANVKPNIVFLDRSSRLAVDRSSSATLRAYAQDEVPEVTRSAQLLNGTAPNVQPSAFASADANALVTGRSVSVDGPTGGAGQSANGRQPLGEADVVDLSKMSGRKFTDAFWLKQVDALSQLRADYQAYVDDGDDSALVAMAKRELIVVEHRLALLSKI